MFSLVFQQKDNVRGKHLTFPTSSLIQTDNLTKCSPSLSRLVSAASFTQGKPNKLRLAEFQIHQCFEPHLPFSEGTMCGKLSLRGSPLTLINH